MGVSHKCILLFTMTTSRRMKSQTGTLPFYRSSEHSIVLNACFIEAGQKTWVWVVSEGEEGERMHVNSTSIPTPCGQGQSTIWPGGGRWLGTPPHHKSSLSLLDTGTWARCCIQAYKLFTEADQMSFKLLNMHQPTRAYQEQDRALAWSDYLFDTFTSMGEALYASVGVLMHRRGLSLWIQLFKG